MRYTMADGTSSVVVLTAGRTMIRPAVTHSDEALGAVVTLMIELKR